MPVLGDVDQQHSTPSTRSSRRYSGDAGSVPPPASSTTRTAGSDSVPVESEDIEERPEGRIVMQDPALSPPDGAYRRTIIGAGPASPSAVRAWLQGVFRPIGRGEARSTELALSDATPSWADQLDRSGSSHSSTSPALAPAYAGALMDQRPSHSSSFDQRRRPETFFTAMATALCWPTSTTSRLPRVMPV